MKKYLISTKCILGCALASMLLVSSCDKEEIAPEQKKVTPVSNSRFTEINFEEFIMNNNSYLDSTVSGSFISKNVSFYNQKGQWSWDGFALSTMRDTVTKGYTNQFSAFAGQGASFSKKYLIGYGNKAKFTLPYLSGNKSVTSIEVTNTTYAALSMRDGDNYAKKFSAAGKDFFKLWIIGYSGGKAKDSMAYNLASFTSVDPSKHYIQKSWKKLKTPKLSNIQEVRFRMESTDNGDWGMNTPAYFAIDNIVIE
jgi:hypothetical protein